MSDYKYYTPVALLDALLEYLPDEQIESVVDISCGSFNLLKSALKKFPKAACVGVDIEEQDVTAYSNIHFIKQDGRIFAKQQHDKKVAFDLVLTNPPFGRLKKEERLFESEQHAILCSRFECEMMYANSLLTREGSYMIAILPATFVEGDRYSKYRKQLSKDYEIRQLIKLPGNVFSRGNISAYAIILYRTDASKLRHTKVGKATYQNSRWIIDCTQTIDVTDIMCGVWVHSYPSKISEEKRAISNIYRGNISSAYFTVEGTEILHCSSSFEEGIWKPLLCHCQRYPLENAKYVYDGDIIINRIGKKAGFWRKYVGRERLVSDCIIVVHGGFEIDEYLSRHSVNGRLNIPLKGVATKYISIADLLSSYFVVQQPDITGAEKTDANISPTE